MPRGHMHHGVGHHGIGHHGVGHHGIGHHGHGVGHHGICHQGHRNRRAKIGGGSVMVNYGNPGSSRCCTMCLLIFLTIVCLIIGLAVTIVGHTEKSFWDEGDDWCSFCKENRIATERRLAICRIVGPIFLAIGFVLLIITVIYTRRTRSEGGGQEGEVIHGEPSETTLTYNQESSAVTINPPMTTLGYPPQPYPVSTGQINTPPFLPQATTVGYPPQQVPIGVQQPYMYPQPNNQYPVDTPSHASPYPSGPADYKQELPPPPSYDATFGEGQI